MKNLDRRKFLASCTTAGIAGLNLPLLPLLTPTAEGQQPADGQVAGEVPGIPFQDTPVDFRYAPADFQSTICFPDDPDKTLVGKRGELRYDFPNDIFASVDQFGTIVEFTVAGMGQDAWIKQEMESPGTPIIHTRLERGNAHIDLIAFATNREREARVDNVLLEVHPRTDEPILAAPVVRIRSPRKHRLEKGPNGVWNIFRDDETKPWIVCLPQTSANLTGGDSDVLWRIVEGGFELHLAPGTARPDAPLVTLFRIAQLGNQSINTAVSAEALLEEMRSWWRQWQPFGGSVQWALPGAHGEFLIACARNIQQAREVKENRLVFEVGPTVYRGLWIVDGNFLLEAARYLGYDDAADQGLLAEWNLQTPTGQIVASAGKEHWKDTGIAIFTLVRSCELKQDWTLLRRLAPNVGHAIDFLVSLRDAAQKSDSLNGRYGLLAPGFPDGGIGGVHDEFTNTLWVLAGLRAAAKANDSLHLPEIERAAPFYRELKAALDRAAADQMITDPRGFRYLPMIMREDPAMQQNAWDRPRPQTSQWALSHTIFPGEVFAKDDPIVRGHIALMKACTQEDIPAETGWLHHEGVWNYNAPFVAEVYLWAGMGDWARRTFTGYLNHASPLRAWREEQPLQQALIGTLWGDMPHNWASAECVRYLRHMLVLEDGGTLRLLEGLDHADLIVRQPFAVTATPTRFGRISLRMEPTGTRGWKLHFTRSDGPAPERVTFRARLSSVLTFDDLRGAAIRHNNGTIDVDPAAREWTASFGV
jgi:hypothetical protein